MEDLSTLHKTVTQESMPIHLANSNPAKRHSPRNKDWANARAAAQANMEPQPNQLCSALFSSTAVSLRALAFARCLRKDAASSDHLPATTPAMTTSLARCLGRTNSGYVRSLRRRADTRRPIRRCQAVLFGQSHRIVMLRQELSPPPTGGRQTVVTRRQPLLNVVDHRLEQVDPSPARTRSWKLFRLLLGKSWRSCFPLRTPAFPEPLPTRTKHDDGQRRQGDGHIGKHAKTGAMGGAIASGAAHGTTAAQCGCEASTAPQRDSCPPEGHP